MSTEAIPSAPYYDVLDRDGEKWVWGKGTYSCRTNPDLDARSWLRLLASRAPLTIEFPVTPVEVGDTVNEDRHFSTLPHGAVFHSTATKHDEVPVVAVSSFYDDDSGQVTYTGPYSSHDYLVADFGPWQRIA